MKHNLTKVTSPADLTVGEKVAWTPYTGDFMQLYRATVEKVTPKGATFSVPDASSYKARIQTFRMRSLYGTIGSPEYFEPYGKDSSGAIFKIITAEDNAAVDASYAQRVKDETEKAAARQAKDEERKRYMAEHRAAALAANEGVTFTEFGTLGTLRYFSANVINEAGRMCMVIVCARRQVDHYNYDENEKGKQVWMGAVNYEELNTDRSEPGTMASCSGTRKGDTLAAMFEEVIAYVY